MSDTECEECGGQVVIDLAHAEPVCLKCGLVVKGETQMQGADDDTQGGPMRGGTTFLSQSRDGNGHSLSEYKRAELRRLEFVANRTRKYKERVGITIEVQVRNIASRLELPDTVRERALFIARAAYEKHMLTGEFSVALAACVYLAARESGVVLIPKTLVSVIDTSAPPARVVSQVFKRYHKLKREFSVVTQPVNPTVVLEVVGSRLFENRRNLVFKAMVELGHITSNTKQNPAHHNPNVDVAAAILVTSLKNGAGLTQAKICEACKVTDVAVRMRLYEQYPDLVKTKVKA